MNAEQRLEQQLLGGDFRSARMTLNRLAQDGVDSNRLRRINAQLNTISQSSELLRRAGLENPYDTAATEKVIKAQARADSGSLTLELYGWLIQNNFTLSLPARQAYLEYLVEKRYFEEAFRLARKLETEQNSASLQRLKARACDGISLTDCAINSLLPLWRQQNLVADGRMLARNLLIQKRYQEAQPVVTAMARKHPDAGWIRTLQQQIDRSVERRIATLKRHYQQNPDDSHLRSLARTQYNNGQQRQAIAALRDHLGTAGGEAETLLLLARYLGWEGAYGEAIGYLKRIENPNNETRLLLAQSLHWSGQAQAARQLLLQLDTALPASDALWQTRLLLGFSYLREGNRQRALQYFEPLQQVQSKVLDKKALKRGLLEARQDYAGLINLTRQAYSANPGDASLALALANDYERSGNIQDAIRYYEEFLRVKPDHSGARLNVGRLYLKDQQLSAGLRHLERYGYQLFTPESLRLLANNYQWTERPADALNVAETMRFSFPADSAVIEYHRQLSERYPQFQQPVEAGLMAALVEADRYFYTHQYRQAASRYKPLLDRLANHDAVLSRYRYSLAQLNPGVGSSDRFLPAMERYYSAIKLSENHQYSRAMLRLKALRRSLPQHVSLDAPLKQFIERWVAAWESREIAQYRQYYSRRYNDNASWISYKSRIFERSDWIKLAVLQPRLLDEETTEDGGQLYRVQFYQYYSTAGHSDIGLKTLQLSCQADRCLISDERWQSGQLPVSGMAGLAAVVELDLIRLRQRSLETEPGDKVITGIYMPPGVKKHPRREDDVLATSYAQADNIWGSSGASGFIEQDRYAAFRDRPEPRANQAGLAFRYFSDSDDVRFREPALRGQYEYGDYELGFRIARFRFNSPECGEEEGGSVEVALSHHNLKGGIYIDRLNDSSRVFPHLSKTFSDDNQTSTLGYSSRNLFFDKLSCRSLQKEIRRHALSFDQYNRLLDGRALWYGLELGYISDSNRDLIGQFDFVFRQRRQQHYHYELAASGWYMWNQEQTDDYYSPEFYDSTKFRLRSYLMPGGNWQFIGDLGLGYTFEDAKKLYSWGLWFQHPFDHEGLVKLGCGRNNSSGSNTGQQSYISTDCRAELEYYWQ